MITRTNKLNLHVSNFVQWGQHPYGVICDGSETVETNEIIDWGSDSVDEWLSYVRRTKLLLIFIVTACLVLGAVLSQLDFFFSPVAAVSIPKTSSMPGVLPEITHENLKIKPDQTIETQTMNGSTTDCLVSDRFPARVLKWCDLISEHASKRGLPPDLVAAVILQESGGNPFAYSQSGAVGLMQVMPKDGIAASFVCVSGPCFASRPASSELNDPAFNISYGTKMLAGLVKKNGSVREGLKSYGPMDVGYSYADKVMGIYARYGK